MQFKLPGRASPEVDSRPSTPADSKTNVWRGRSFHKTSDAAAAAASATDGGADGGGDMTGRLPKRSNSFGLGLGGLQSLANGMSRAGESLSRKTTGTSSDGTKTPPTSSHSHAAATSNAAHVPMGPPTLPDSSHLAQFSLRLSELVNRAFMPCTGVNTSNSTPASSGFAGAAKNAAAISSVVAYQGIPSLASITYDGKKLPSKAVIAEIAKTVVGELEYASSVDPYLLRAASRSALKALSLFADRIDSLFVSPSKDPSVVFVPASAKEGIHIPASLEFNLGLITLEWIVEDALERCIEGPPGTENQGMPHFVSEILTPVRKKMEGTILRTIQPLMANVKVSLTQCIYKAVPLPFSGFGHGLSPVPSLTSPLVDSSAPPTPSGVLTPGTAGVSWLRELEGRLDGCRRLLVPRIEERCGQDGEGWFISVAIHLIWKGLLVLTSRTMPMPHSALIKPCSPNLVPISIGNAIATDATKRSPSPAQLTSALKSVSVKPRKASGAEASSGHSTPAHGSYAANGTASKATLQQVQELQAFEKLVLKFAAGFEPSKSKTSAMRVTAADESDSSDEDDDEDELARAALAEALQAIKSTILTVQYLDRNPDSLLDVLFTHQKDRVQHSLPAEVVRAAKATPPLLLLHLVYARMPTHLATFASVIKEGGQRTEPVVPSPPSVFAYTWSEYERGIAGFAGGQSWAYALVDAWTEDVEEATHLLDERERKLISPQEEEAVEVSTSMDPSDSTPTPESVLLRRTASAQSVDSDLDSVPEEMTASAPALDTETARVAPATSRSATAVAQKPSAWASLKQSRLKSPAQSSDVSDTSASPETSPPRSPHQGASTEVSKSKRFWRSQSSQAGASTGFHLMGVGKNQAARSSSSVNANGASAYTAQTEEERLHEEIRLEREGLRLMRKTIEAVDAVRRPKVSAEHVTNHS